MVNERAVRILLECILVKNKLTGFSCDHFNYGITVSCFMAKTGTFDGESSNVRGYFCAE